MKIFSFKHILFQEICKFAVLMGFYVSTIKVDAQLLFLFSEI